MPGPGSYFQRRRYPPRCRVDIVIARRQKAEFYQIRPLRSADEYSQGRFGSHCLCSRPQRNLGDALVAEKEAKILAWTKDLLLVGIQWQHM